MPINDLITEDVEEYIDEDLGEIVELMTNEEPPTTPVIEEHSSEDVEFVPTCYLEKPKGEFNGAIWKFPNVELPHDGEIVSTLVSKSSGLDDSFLISCVMSKFKNGKFLEKKSGKEFCPDLWCEKSKPKEAPENTQLLEDIETPYLNVMSSSNYIDSISTWKSVKMELPEEGKNVGVTLLVNVDEKSKARTYRLILTTLTDGKFFENKTGNEIFPEMWTYGRSLKPKDN